MSASLSSLSSADFMTPPLVTLLDNLTGMAYRARPTLPRQFEWISAGCQSLTGYSPNAFRDDRDLFERIVYYDDKVELHRTLIQALEQKQRFTLEYRLRHANGQTCWVRDQGIGVYASDGELIGIEGLVTDITDTRALAEHLNHQTTHDTLTGLLNRTGFDERLSSALSDCRRFGSEHVLCFFDLDQFKIVNETCGHQGGDAVLRQIGDQLLAQVRRYDVVARLGGDEFGLLLKDCPLDRALSIVENLRTTIANIRFRWHQESFRVTVSAGIVALRNTKVLPTELIQGATLAVKPKANQKRLTLSKVAVLKAADAACIAAKNRGRNRVYVYSSSDDELTQLKTTMDWARRLQQALDEGRLRLAAQPIVSLLADAETQANACEYYEILIRMDDGSGGLIMPGQFLAAAERYDLAASVDRWVIERTLRWAHDTMEPRATPYVVCVNLSGQSMTDESLATFVKTRLARWSICPRRVCFEITETAAITHLSTALQIIEALRNHGCRFALDDFGTGVSSLGYLKNLPVDFVKIDGLFVKNLANDSVDLAMVKAINDICHQMGLKTIAEFIEDETTVTHLKTIGVDYGQGYHIGRPQLVTQS